MGDRVDLAEGRVPVSARRPGRGRASGPSPQALMGGGPRSESGLPNSVKGDLFQQMEPSGDPCTQTPRSPGGLPSVWPAEGHGEGALSDVPSRPGGQWPILSCHLAVGLGPRLLTVLPAVLPAVPPVVSNSWPLGLGRDRQGHGLPPAQLPIPHHRPCLLLAFAAGVEYVRTDLPGGGDGAGGIGEGVT